MAIAHSPSTDWFHAHCAYFAASVCEAEDGRFDLVVCVMGKGDTGSAKDVGPEKESIEANIASNGLDRLVGRRAGWKYGRRIV